MLFYGEKIEKNNIFDILVQIYRKKITFCKIIFVKVLQLATFCDTLFIENGGDYMLKSYEVSNFKSFKQRTFFDFSKTNYQILLNTNVIEDTLKGIMFVGANASGKSNSIAPIKFLLDCLFGKNDIRFDPYMCLFSENPVLELKYNFLINNSEIKYEIRYQRIDKIIYENLFVDHNEILTREGSVATVCISDQIVHTDIPQDLLFLRDVYFSTKFRGNDTLQKWFEFLSNSVYLDIFHTRIIPYNNEDLSLKVFMEDEGADKFNKFFDEYNFGHHIEYDKKSTGNIISVEAPEKMIYFKRVGIDEPIPYVLESLGNRNLLHLLPAFFHCINNNSMLLLDEFSSGFHNELEELLIRYFMKNSQHSQLIFVSHSTNLLSNSLLRPDQIYSVDFDKNGSHIKRFSSEQPRIAQNLEKMYLGGVFNGVPQYERKDK